MRLSTEGCRSIVSVLSVMLVAASPTASLAQTPDSAAQPSSQPGELSIEQLVDMKIDSVYGASKFTQRVTQAPSSITIVTADEIRKHGHTTLAGVLRGVRGFYITYDRNYSFVGVRGFSRPGDYNSRVLLLIDGHQLNDNVFGGALLGTEFPLDVDLIERLEIIRGPSSSLYGTSAFFAVINIITRRVEAGPWAEASAALGSLDTRKGRLTYGQALPNGVGLFLSASAYDSQGQRSLFFEEFNSPETNNGIARDADSDQFAKLFGRVTFGDFTLHGLYSNREKAIPTASFGTVFNDNRSRTIEQWGYVDLRHDRRLKGAWALASRLYYDRYGYDGDYVFEVESDTGFDRVVNKDFARGNWWGGETTLSGRVAARHRLAVGAEYRDNVRQDQYNYDETPFVEYLDDQRDSQIWALYGQDEISLHQKLILNVGLRYDHYSTVGGSTSPRLGLIYEPRERTTLKLLYGRAFRAPNAYELFWRQSDVAKANPLLRPETNQTGELVLEQYVGDRLRASATGFFYKVDGLITQETDPLDGLLVYNNVDTIVAKGFELEAEGRWPTGLRSRMSYTFQNSHDERTGQTLTDSPRHLTQFSLLLPLLKDRVSAGVEFQHLSARRTLDGTEVKGVLVPNLTLVSQQLTQGLELSASFYNLSNRRYADPGSEEHRQNAIGQDGRTFRVKMTYTFQHGK